MGAAPYGWPACCARARGETRFRPSTTGDGSAARVRVGAQDKNAGSPALKEVNPLQDVPSRGRQHEHVRGGANSSLGEGGVLHGGEVMAVELTPTRRGTCGLGCCRWRKPGEYGCEVQRAAGAGGAPAPSVAAAAWPHGADGGGDRSVVGSTVIQNLTSVRTHHSRSHAAAPLSRATATAGNSTTRSPSFGVRRRAPASPRARIFASAVLQYPLVADRDGNVRHCGARPA